MIPSGRNRGDFKSRASLPQPRKPGRVRLRAGHFETFGPPGGRTPPRSSSRSRARESVARTPPHRLDGGYPARFPVGIHPMDIVAPRADDQPGTSPSPVGRRNRKPIMKETKLSMLSARYLTALRAHFTGGRQKGLRSALSVGRRAASLGLETLDLAGIHDFALGMLALPCCTAGARVDRTRRGVRFFTEAMIPIEEAHRVARDLADSNRELKKELQRCKAAENELKTNGAESARLLEETRHLQEYLQNMAHQILSAQEDERNELGHTMQDEIAQTLLGIHTRLLALKNEVTNGRTDFEKEIATTQRLVEKSVRTINRLAREFGPTHEN